jgi:pilus assembly protein CpaF
MISVTKSSNGRELHDNGSQAITQAAGNGNGNGSHFLMIEPLDLPKQHSLEEIHRIHQILIARLSARDFSEADRQKLHRATREIINELGLQANGSERDEVANQVVDEIIGLGPIEPLMRDDRITDIMINSPKDIFCEIDGVNHMVPIEFRDDNHLMNVVNRIVSAVNRRVDESSPIVNARLMDGSRVNVILPPLAIKGPTVCIRKFGKKKIRAKELLEKKSLTPGMLEFLQAAVQARINIIISGNTGGGKTTLLNTIALAIPHNERILTIEDSAELQIGLDNVVSLETRLPSLEGKGAVSQRDLVINALRMKPDRIIIGECRGPEAFDMLQAMNTGHEGSLTTIHANTARDAISRIQGMILQAELGMSEKAIDMQISSAVQIIVQVLRLSDGSRRVKQISEITGMQSGVISMQDIFTFKEDGRGTDGRIHGVFKGGEIVPQCMDKIKLIGKSFEAGFWTQRVEV